MLTNLNKQDNGEYECLLPSGERESVKLTVYGKENDLNSLDSLEYEITNEVNQLEVQNSSVINENSSNPDISLRRLYQQRQPMSSNNKMNLNLRSRYW